MTQPGTTAQALTPAGKQATPATGTVPRPITLIAHQFRYDLRAFFRNRQSQFFTLALPVLFLVIFASVFGGNGDTVKVAGGRIDTSVSYEGGNGVAVSPDGSTVFVTGGSGKGPTVLALNTATGARSRTSRISAEVAASLAETFFDLTRTASSAADRRQRSCMGGSVIASVL